MRSGGIYVLRILVTDVSRVHREALAHLLQSAVPDVQVLAASVSDALSLASEYRPDVILHSLRAPHGAEQLRRLAHSTPQARHLVLGAGETEEEVVTLFEAGASGYHPPDGSMDEMWQSIGAAVRGEAICSPRLAGALVRRIAAAASPAGFEAAEPSLTRREREILVLIDRGLTNKEIARSLKVSLSTVKNHVHRIITKLEVRSRAGAAAWLRRNRLSPTGRADPTAGTCGHEPPGI